MRTLYARAEGDIERKYENGESVRQIVADYAEAYEPADSTYWLTVHVYEKDEDDNKINIDFVKVAVDPELPPCVDGAHEWRETGVRGEGGGVIVGYTCSKCGLEKVLNTWATDPDDGEQGLRSVTYLDSEGRVWKEDWE